MLVPSSSLLPVFSAVSAKKRWNGRMLIKCMSDSSSLFHFHSHSYPHSPRSPCLLPSNEFDCRQDTTLQTKRNEEERKKIHIKKNLRSCRKQQVQNCQYNANENDVFKLEKTKCLGHHVHINTDNIMSVSMMMMKKEARGRETRATKQKPISHRFNRFLNAFVYAGCCRCRRRRRRCRRLWPGLRVNAANIGNYQHSILHIIVKTSIKYQLPNKNEMNAKYGNALRTMKAGSINDNDDAAHWIYGRDTQRNARILIQNEAENAMAAIHLHFILRKKRKK